MNKTNKISAILIVYHEEKIIQRALSNIKDVVDEIIVVHDGKCKDNTLEIASKYSNKIFERQRMGNPEFHRIFAINKACNDWILWIDADEYLSPELKKNITDLTKSQKVDAYSFIWPIWDGEKYLTQTFPRKSVLFRRNKAALIAYPGVPRMTIGKTKKVNLVLEHKPLYNNYSFKYLLTKWRKWAERRAKHIFADNIEFYNISIQKKRKFRKKLKIQKRLAFPLFFPLWFLYSFFKSLLKHRFYKKFSTIKISLLQGFYAIIISYYIWKMKRKR
jgi:glycosyltransferase involved in cell wall biosynthesis